jgi:hypothetical protein
MGQGSSQTKLSKMRYQTRLALIRLTRECERLKGLEAQQAVTLREAAGQPNRLRARAKDLLLTRRHLEKMENFCCQLQSMVTKSVSVAATEHLLSSMKALTQSIEDSKLTWEKSEGLLSDFTDANADMEDLSTMIGDAMDATQQPSLNQDIDAEVDRVLDEFALTTLAMLPAAPRTVAADSVALSQRDSAAAAAAAAAEAKRD